MANPSTRRTLSLGLCASLLLAGAARADVCPEQTQPKSCHKVRPTAEEANTDAVVSPLGKYTPFVWNEGHVRLEPPTGNGAYATSPGLDLTIGAGGWGAGAKEPMAIARTSFAYLTDTNVSYLNPPPPSSPAYRFGCTEGTDLCASSGVASPAYAIWTTSSAFLQRMYRLTKINPAALPGGVTSVPLLIDYKVGIHVTGRQELKPTGDIEGLTASTAVLFGYFTQSSASYGYSPDGVTCSISNGIRCSSATSGMQLSDVSGNEHSGTFAFGVPLDALELIALRVNASLYVPTSPQCRDRQIGQETICLVSPFGASGHAVADPYVYIDPAWAYASWFKLEIAEDETDTTWTIPERVRIDTESLTVVDGEVTDGGSPATSDAAVEPLLDAGEGGSEAGADSAGSGSGGGDESNAGSNPMGGGAGTGDGAENPDTAKQGGDGGCHLASGRTAGLSPYALAAAAVMLARRRRRTNPHLFAGSR